MPASRRRSTVVRLATVAHPCGANCRAVRPGKAEPPVVGTSSGSHGGSVRTTPRQPEVRSRASVSSRFVPVLLACIAHLDRRGRSPSRDRPHVARSVTLVAGPSPRSPLRRRRGRSSCRARGRRCFVRLVRSAGPTRSRYRDGLASGGGVQSRCPSGLRSTAPPRLSAAGLAVSQTLRAFACRRKPTVPSGRTPTRRCRRPPRRRTRPARPCAPGAAT